jgi:hypothetical protein
MFKRIFTFGLLVVWQQLAAQDFAPDLAKDLKQFSERENAQQAKLRKPQTIQEDYVFFAELGYGAGRLQYSEIDFAHDQGLLQGPRLQFGVESENLKAELDFEYLSGRVQTILTDNGDETGSLDKTDQLIQGRFLMGPHFGETTKWLQFFVGVGRRSLNVEFHRGPLDNHRVIYDYLPMGLRFKASLGKNITIGLSGEYDYFLQGRVESQGTDDTVLEDSSFQQNQGSGFRVALPVKFKLGSIYYKWESFYRYWRVNASSQRVAFFKPLNRTRYYGLSLSALF